jgi:hypothetical protein
VGNPDESCGFTETAYPKRARAIGRLVLCFVPQGIARRIRTSLDKTPSHLNALDSRRGAVDVAEVTYAEREHVGVMRDFLNDPGRFVGG